MSRIKGRDTKFEILVRSVLHKDGLRFRKNVKDLPGKPDIVFRKARVVVFIDGDFWHGYDFNSWSHKVSEFWKKKIGCTIQRDIKNHDALRQLGWNVIRLWEHELEKDFSNCITKIVSAVRTPTKERILG